MGSYTPKRNLYKPDIGERGWGDLVNQNWDILDAHEHDASEITSGRLPLSRLPDGPAGKVLMAQGEGKDPAWSDIPVGLDPIQFLLKWWIKIVDDFTNIPCSVDGSASVSRTYADVLLQTGTTSGSSAAVSLIPTNIYNFASFDKKRLFAANVKIDNNTNQHVSVASGLLLPADIGSVLRNYFGFYVIDDVLYIGVGNENGYEEQQIKTISAGEQLFLSAVLYPGSKCEFYVNGEKVGKLTNYLPQGTSNATRMVNVYIKNTAAENKTIDVNSLAAGQEV